jgi:hypothetical protein
LRNGHTAAKQQRAGQNDRSFGINSGKIHSSLLIEWDAG